MGGVMLKNSSFRKYLVICLIILFIGVSVSASQYEKKEQTPILDCFDSYDEPLNSEDIASIQEIAESEGWSFTVGETSASKRSMVELCGLVEPDNWREDAEFDPIMPLETLPSKFDWREQVVGGLPPVRDQGSCGSCWAFATIGALECNIKIRDKVSVDLSEQWLVSCNQETVPRKWGCNGGWWAHDYFIKNAKKDPCGNSGAVLEKNFPYTAEDDDCECPYQHDYFIERSAYVGSEHDVPSVDALKQAIYDFGPVTVAVCASIYFKIYESGVYDYESICWPGKVNHGVVLVGWDDTLGDEGVWILRNSWGDDWGEDGYMYIEYGCSMVGYAARYVEYSDRLTVVCANESISQDPGSSNQYHGISNAKVTVRSSDGTIEETGWTNSDGRCYFYDLPKDKSYNVHATHIFWEQKEIDWKSQNFVVIIMKSKNSRAMIAQYQFIDHFPILRLIFRNLIRISAFIK
jgi:C1A family cysteine protease